MEKREGGSKGITPGKILQFVPLRMHFKHSRAKVRVLNRTGTSFNLSFFIQGQHMNTFSFFFFFFNLLFVPILMNHLLFQYDLTVLNHV